MSEVRKTILHPQGEQNVDLYPKTNVEQVEDFEENVNRIINEFGQSFDHLIYDKIINVLNNAGSNNDLSKRYIHRFKFSNISTDIFYLNGLNIDVISLKPDNIHYNSEDLSFLKVGRLFHYNGSIHHADKGLGILSWLGYQDNNIMVCTFTFNDGTSLTIRIDGSKLFNRFDNYGVIGGFIDVQFV